MTKTERLLREMRRLDGGMSHKQIVQFILDMNHGIGKVEFNTEHHRDMWNSTLYGTRDRTGILENFCTKNWYGNWQVSHNIQGPFTTKRDNQDTRYY